jgi:hypothetical protein
LEDRWRGFVPGVEDHPDSGGDIGSLSPISRVELGASFVQEAELFSEKTL